MSDLDARLSQRANELAANAEPPEDEELECLDDYGEGTCTGAVEYRMPLSGTGKSFPRCDGHWDARLAKQEELREYESDTPPDWFDESYAGERWDEDY